MGYPIVLSTTPQMLVKGDNDRKTLFFENNDATITEYIAWSVASLLSSTVFDKKLLAAQNVSFDAVHDPNLVVREWWGVAASGTPTITVIEG